MKNTLLKNGTVIHADGQKKEDIFIENNKIATIGEVSTILDAEIIDCQDRLIFPGIIDAHTHMGVPIKDGYSADDFESGSKSALNGGVTTIIDFTVLRNNQTLLDSILERKKHAENSIIDVAFHCNITRFDKNILKEIPQVIKQGITSFKVFTTYREAGMMLSYKEIEEISQVISDHGGLLMVHAEDNEIILNASSPLIAQNLTEAKYHAIARPAEAEKIAIEHIANISEKTGCEVYIVHLNTAAGLKIARDCGNMFVETCPQYLLLDDSVYERPDGQMFVASPPLRKQSDCEALWQGVKDGSVDVIATDHCPFMLIDKPRRMPFQNIPNGMGGVETLFPVMLARFIKRGIDLNRLVQLLSTNPAKIFNLFPQKGAISKDTDANLVIVDPNTILNEWSDKLVSVTDWNAYVGFPAIFPERVIYNGQVLNLS